MPSLGNDPNVHRRELRMPGQDLCFGRPRDRLELLPPLENLRPHTRVLGKRENERSRPALALERPEDVLPPLHLPHDSLQLRPAPRPAARPGLEGDVLRPERDQELVEGRVVLQVAFRLALLDAVERWLRDVDVPSLHQLRELPVEEGEKKRPDVRPVDVGVGHDDDRVVAKLGEIPVFPADARPQGGNQEADLLRGQHLVEARFFHVEDLAAER
ncbi:MAG: hypothetical protein KatS3mg076_2895 [Candidatus Binatia bacterium]|nr:MAG: hypothetical protein KatS3mg076_2895 [Candidatus Binatia bacterium]